MRESLEVYNPALIVSYLYEVAKTFTNFYHHHKVLDADDKTREARLALLQATKQVLKNGLDLLGIDTLEEM